MQDKVIKPLPTSPINRKIPKVNTGMTEDLRHTKIRHIPTGQSKDSMSEELMSITSKEAQDSHVFCSTPGHPVTLLGVMLGRCAGVCVNQRATAE